MDKVCVLLSTYNGEKYLETQIRSIFAQKNVNIIMIVRDDGSKDSTISILEELAKRYPILMPAELNGYHCKEGVGSSYLRLLRYALKNYPDIDFFSFADQDDVWKNDKLSKGVEKIQNSGCSNSLYFSRKQIVDENLEICGQDIIRIKHNLCDYLCSNDAFGCTMVFTRNFAECVLSSAAVDYMPFLHDIVLFNIATLIGANIIYDEYESILYRQHGNNTTGVNTKRLFTRKNISKIFLKRNHFTMKFTEMMLCNYKDLLTNDAKVFLELIKGYRNPLSAIKLISYFFIHSGRGLRDKLKFLASIILNGI